MPEPELAQLADQPWGTWSYREVLVRLLGQGWLPCGVGDWAIGLRSPDGMSAARVCPFDPAYAAFLELCRRCAGNPWLPRVELSADLEGGGSLTVLEFLAPADKDFATQVAQRWRSGEGKSDGESESDGEGGEREFNAVRQAAQQIDAEFRARMPWWDGFDLNAAHIRRAADNRPVLIDVFCMDGAAMYGQILEDAAEFYRLMPRDRSRYAVEIPYISRENSAEEIRILRKALELGLENEL